LVSVDLVSVDSVVFFFPVFLVCFLVVFFWAPEASFDCVVDCVFSVFVPVTGFVEDFDSVEVEAEDCWAKRPAGRATMAAIAMKRDKFFCMACFSFRGA
jgi:hypothetical protein